MGVQRHASPQLASAPQRGWSHLTLACDSRHYCAFSVACSLLAALATTGLPQGVTTKPESVSVTSTDAFKSCLPRSGYHHAIRYHTHTLLQPAVSQATATKIVNQEIN